MFPFRTFCQPLKTSETITAQTELAQNRLEHSVPKMSLFLHQYHGLEDVSRGFTSCFTSTISRKWLVSGQKC